MKKWENSELVDLWSQYKKGITREAIASSFNVSTNSIHKQLKKLKKKHGEYDVRIGDRHWNKEKIRFHEAILNRYKPRRVLEGYAGQGRYTRLYQKYSEEIVAIEKDPKQAKLLAKYSKTTVICGDIEKEILNLIIEKRTFDLIDLDSFGSCWKPLLCALDCVKNGVLVFTFGEIIALGFRRYETILKRYPILISDIDSGSVHNMLLQLIGYLCYEGLRRNLIVKPIGIIGKGLQPRRIYLEIKKSNHNTALSYFYSHVSLSDISYAYIGKLNSGYDAAPAR